MAAIAFVCVLAAWAWAALVNQSVIQDANRRSLEWGEYAASRLDRLEALAQGEVSDRRRMGGDRGSERVRQRVPF